MNSPLQALQQEIADHPVMQSPLVKSFASAESITRQQAARFGLLYYPHILKTRLYQANALGITPDENIQFVLADILYDEYGNGDPAKSHMEQYRQFLRACGVSEDEMTSAAIIPELKLYIDGMMLLTQSSDWLAAVAAVGIASEWPIPDIYTNFVTGLRKVPGITDDDLKLFIGHIQLDIEHSRMIADAIEPHLKTKSGLHTARNGILYNLDARMVFMNAIHGQVFE